jgi:hypothetical protein
MIEPWLTPNFSTPEEIHHPMELKVLAALVWGAAEGPSISHLPWDKPETWTEEVMGIPQKTRGIDGNRWEYSIS